jgi:hypothetical protein
MQLVHVRSLITQNPCQERAAAICVQRCMAFYDGLPLDRTRTSHVFVLAAGYVMLVVAHGPCQRQTGACRWTAMADRADDNGSSEPTSVCRCGGRPQ